MELLTTYDMYIAFLDGIKKYGTGIVDPNAFNRIINEWGQDEWVKSIIRKGPEITEEIQEKLSSIRVITDDVFAYSYRIDLTDKKTLASIPSNEFVSTYTNIMGVSGNSAMPKSDKYFMYPLGNKVVINEVEYPAMIRLLGVSFKLLYKNNDCHKDGEISNWLNAHVLYSDQRSILKKNPYRKPTDERLYYEILRENFVLTNDTESKGYRLRLDYLRKPRVIFFNTNNTSPEEEQVGVPDYSGTITSGSINCEFPQDLRMEIVNVAVRTFIERIKDPRYQTFINELNIKKNG